MSGKRSIYKNLALITQLGLNVMVPTFLCLFIGIWIGKFIGTWVVIPLLFLGMAAGMRNCYMMAKNASHDGADADKSGKEVSGDGQHEEDH